MTRNYEPAESAGQRKPDSLVGAGLPHPGDRSGLPLETKLHAPGLRREWVERQGLIHRLVDVKAKLILIDAPAGFGKTILVAQWRASPLEDRPFAWVSLDPGDNDPVRLWRHVASALQRACPEPGIDGAMAALAAPAPDITGAFVPALVNWLAMLPARVVLVLDDYDTIKERRCRHQVGFLLRHLPPSAQIVLITRADPALQLGRLRAAGDIAEIRMGELKFGRDEAAAVVGSVADVRLSEPDLADLVERTEGWPAGVYLAALSLRGHPSPSGFIRQFTGSNRYIAEFLVEEVTARQPEPIRRFLTRTAILSRFTAPLCDAVAGSDNAAEIIDILERANLFLVPLDDERRWFRYHHLFAQMLSSQLMRTEPRLSPALHARASAWYRERGSPDEAVSHALAAGDIAGAVGLTAAHWYAYVSAGRIATVSAWIGALAKAGIDANPVAAHCAAWVAALTGDGDTLRRWLPVVEAGQHDGPLPDGIRSLESSAALLRGTFGFDGIREMRESASEAVKLEDDPASPWYALARAGLGWSLYLSGAAKQAQVPLQEAVLARALIPLVRMLTLSVMALIALDLGRIAQAEALARAARDMTATGELRESPQSALAHTAAGAVHVRQGRIQEARREFEGALRIRRGWFGISPWVTVETQLRLAAAMLDLGEGKAAVALLSEASDLLNAAPADAEALRARLERTGRRFVASAPAAKPRDQLTERERRILRLLQGTLSRREIGDELHLSVNTIKTHTRVIYRKLGASTRQEAVERGRQLGMM